MLRVNDNVPEIKKRARLYIVEQENIHYRVKAILNCYSRFFKYFFNVIDVPAHRVVGDKTTLICQFDMEENTLHSVKCVSLFINLINKRSFTINHPVSRRINSVEG